MNQSSLYRKTSMERIESPEQLNNYLRVTNPSVWIILIAAALILAGALIWGSFAYIDSFVTGTAEVKNGVMTISFEDEAKAKNVTVGMNVTVDDTESTIVDISYTPDGNTLALAETTLSDNFYQATISYRRTNVLQLLFN